MVFGKLGIDKVGFMERKFVLEAIKIALIASVKKQMPKEGFKCKVCEIPFHKLHRIDIRGIGVYYMCEHCVEELQEYFIKQSQSALDEVFTEQIQYLLGQGCESAHIDEDFDDYGSLYAHAMYARDHE
jgi:hypothetical protein